MFRLVLILVLVLEIGRIDTAPKTSWHIRLEFRVHAEDAVMRQSRLKAELRTGAVRGCAPRNPVCSKDEDEEENEDEDD